MRTSKFMRFAYAAVALCAAVGVKVCAGAEVQHAGGARPVGMEQRFYHCSDGFVDRICEAAEAIGEASRDFHACFKAVLGLFNVEWPDGSLSVNVKTLGGVRVLNTPQNHAKIEAALNVLDTKPYMVELDCRFVEAGREALAAAGYFATNRVDGAALLSRLMARDDVKVLAAPRMIGRNGEEIISKHVKRIRYPQDYDVLIDEGTSNTVRRTSAVAVEPQNFEEREVGVTVVATPTILEDGNVRVHLEAKLVDEPEWKDFGVKAAWEGAASYDLVMEQPMFPERLSLDAYLSLNLGETVVIGGVTDSREKNEGRFVFLFVTARVTNGEGTEMTPGTLRKCEKLCSFAKDGMEARTYVVIPFSGCHLREKDAEQKKSPDEIAADAANTTKTWKSYFAEVHGVEWPSGSDVHYMPSLALLWVKTTPLNFDKLDVAYEKAEGARPVEMDFRILEAGREALDAAGYFATNRVDGAALLSRLMARDDVKLLEAPRVAVTDNSEATMKGLMLYRYPQDFNVMIGTGAEPQNFEEQEVGTIISVTPGWRSEDLLDLSIWVKLYGKPEWKNYGADAKWKKAKAYDLKMEQPFFRERVDINNRFIVKPGTTVLLGGGADAPDGRDKAVLVFMTPRSAGKVQP